MTKEEALNEEYIKSIALLIDGENISPKHFSLIRRDLARRGTNSIFRIYADWTSETLAKGWKEDVLSEHPFVAIQQFSLASGKSSSDSALIIDAMDLVYSSTKKPDCIALASSDSDFTRLALNLREKNIKVIGYGEEKTPPRLRNACHEFVTLSMDESGENDAHVHSIAKQPVLHGIDKLIYKSVIEQAVYEDNWCNLNELSLYLRRIKSDFDVAKNLRVKKLSDYFKVHEANFELKINGPGAAYVRVKDQNGL